MTISGGRTEQFDIFCRVTGFTSDFLSSIHCRGPYSVLSRRPSVVYWIMQCCRVKYILHDSCRSLKVMDFLGSFSRLERA